MKYILSKAKTAIILLLVTVIFLGFYTFLLTRPISYGMKYHNETVYEGIKFEGTFKFYRGGKMVIENDNFDEPFACFYYYENGYIFSLWGETEEEREAERAYIKENFEEMLAKPLASSKMNAFLCTAQDGDYVETYACKGLFVFAVFGGVLAAALIGFTGSSLVFFQKAKRAKQKITISQPIPENTHVNSGYKEQKNLSMVQFLAETPSFIMVLVSAILSRTLLVFVDVLDSFGYLLRTGMVTLLSNKLSKNQGNVGSEKLEAKVSLFCDGIVLVSFLITLGLSLYSIIFPDPPSGFVIAVVGLKVINVCFDTTFFLKQRDILKTQRSPISETNYAAALAALLFDSITLVSLLAMWLLRNNPIGGYISPVISIVVAIYLMVGCIKRAVRVLADLTDKTLSQEQ